MSIMIFLKAVFILFLVKNAGWQSSPVTSGDYFATQTKIHSISLNVIFQNPNYYMNYFLLLSNKIEQQI